MGHFGRPLVGFIVAPIVPGLLVGLFLLLIAGGDLAALGFAIYAVAVSALLGYPAALLLGLPAFALLQRGRRAGLGPYAVCGALFGVAVTLTFAVMPWTLCDIIVVFGVDACFVAVFGLGFMTTAAGSGGVAGVAFWLIVRPPSRLGPPPLPAAASAGRSGVVERVGR